MTAQELLSLAERVERATGADRNLDAMIHARDGLEGVGHWQDAPAYTASLDAAMTLLDQYGVLMHLSDIGADGLPLAKVGRPDLDNAPIFAGIASCIMTDTSPVAGLALALCAAALRARASEAGGRG
jgi:hypothetical protein